MLTKLLVGVPVADVFLLISVPRHPNVTFDVSNRQLDGAGSFMPLKAGADSAKPEFRSGWDLIAQLHRFGRDPSLNEINKITLGHSFRPGFHRKSSDDNCLQCSIFYVF